MQTDREKDGRTDMMKIPVTIHDFLILLERKNSEEIGEG